jgi:hypothetical protein
VKIINETILDDVSDSEAEEIAEILQNRNSISRFLGVLTYTYSEIEKVK